MLKPNVIIMYPGTHASIPTGFSRDTNFDDRFLKGTAASVEPNVAGGNATHSHSSPSHNHVVANHTHTFTTSNTNHRHSDANKSDAGESDILGDEAHTHSGTSSNPTSTTSSGQAVTYASYSNDPPYFKVIFIKAVGNQQIPDDCILFHNDSSVPTGFARHSTADNKYYKGASTSGDGGGTGGSTTNAHTIAHTHTDNHLHSATSGASNGSAHRQSGANAPFSMTPAHTHGITMNSAGKTSDSNSSIGNQAETVEPAYKKLLAIQNTSGISKRTEKKMVAMWTGLLADIPQGWVLCDGNNDTEDMRGKYIKNAATTGQVGDTGGSNTHSHAAEAHTHNVSSHNHGGTVADAAEDTGRKASGVQEPCWGGANSTTQPNHTLPTVQSKTYTLGSSNTTANSSNNEPQYRTVAFIQFVQDTSGTALFFAKLMSLLFLLPGAFSAIAQKVTATMAALDNRGRMSYC